MEHRAPVPSLVNTPSVAITWKWTARRTSKACRAEKEFTEPDVGGLGPASRGDNRVARRGGGVHRLRACRRSASAQTYFLPRCSNVRDARARHRQTQAPP